MSSTGSSPTGAIGGVGKEGLGMGSKTLRGRRQEYAPSEGAIQRDGRQTYGNRKGVKHRVTQFPGADQEAPKGQGGRRPLGPD